MSEQADIMQAVLDLVGDGYTPTPIPAERRQVGYTPFGSIPSSSIPFCQAYSAVTEPEQLEHRQEQQNTSFALEIIDEADAGENIRLAWERLRGQFEADRRLTGLVDFTQLGQHLVNEQVGRGLVLGFGEIQTERYLDPEAEQDTPSAYPPPIMEQFVQDARAKIGLVLYNDQTKGGMQSDVATDRESLRAGEVRYQLHVDQRTADEETSANTSFPVADLRLTVHHMLTDPQNERAYTEGLMRAHQALFADPKWWQSTVKYVYGPDRERTLEIEDSWSRNGNVISYTINVGLLINPL